jgi:hypothetical protein
VAEKGPSKDRLKQLQERAKKPADVLVLAEAGDHLAAFLVGSTFADS